jgi:hypothetical protein
MQPLLPSLTFQRWPRDGTAPAVIKDIAALNGLLPYCCDAPERIEGLLACPLTAVENLLAADVRQLGAVEVHPLTAREHKALPANQLEQPALGERLDSRGRNHRQRLLAGGPERLRRPKPARRVRVSLTETGCFPMLIQAPTIHRIDGPGRGPPWT